MNHLPDFGKFDLSYRPATYWSESRRARANITGSFRRAVLDKALAQHNPSAAHAALAEPAPGLNEALGAIHPSLRSGEDLPPTKKHETEIARITLNSIHGEVTSIRARMVNSRICFLVEDEMTYEFGYKFKAKPRSSSQPLTLAGLIDLINNIDCRTERGEWYQTGVVLPHWDRLEGDKEVVDFVRVTSHFYPQLKDWFQTYFWHLYPNAVIPINPQGNGGQQ